MTWRVVVRAEAQSDIAEAATWYDAQGPGLGTEFREEVITVFDSLADNPFLNSRVCGRVRNLEHFTPRFTYPM